MAFDGFVISNIVTELKQKIAGGRIYKIYQPETDEITRDQKGTKHDAPAYLCKRISSVDLPDNRNQNKSYAGSKFLYAFTKTFKQRTDRFHLPAGF